MTRPSPFKTLSTRIAYKNPWMQVREDEIIRPDGTEGIYGVIESKDAVIAIIVDEQRQICFVNVFRYPAQAWKWELPGGGSDGQEAVAAAMREASEEAGIVAETWHVLGKSRVCNGLMTENQTSVLAYDLTYESPTDKEEGISEHRFIPLEEVDRMIASGEIDDGQSITALYLYKNWLADKTLDGRA